MSQGPGDIDWKWGPHTSGGIFPHTTQSPHNIQPDIAELKKLYEQQIYQPPQPLIIKDYKKIDDEWIVKDEYSDIEKKNKTTRKLIHIHGISVYSNGPEVDCYEAFEDTGWRCGKCGTEAPDSIKMICMLDTLDK